MKFKDIPKDSAWFTSPETLAVVDLLIEMQGARTQGAHSAMRLGSDEKLREARGLLGEADGFQKCINLLSRRDEA